MSRDITISGNLQYRDRSPIDGARIRIWEVDPHPRNDDDLIVDVTTGSAGTFRGTGRWKDSRRPEVGRYRYEVKHQGRRKTGGNILNPHKFFDHLKMPWDPPSPGGSAPSGSSNADLTINGRLLASGQRLAGARIRIWETDIEPKNPDDLIVDDITDSNGKFSGSGNWRDASGPIDVATFRYEITLANLTLTGTTKNPNKHFKQFETGWPTTVHWRNWNSNFSASMRRENFRQPTSPDEVRRVLQDAVGKKLKVKVVGSGHSMSPVAQPARNNIAVDISAMSGLLPRYSWEKPRSALALASKRDLVHAQAGTTVRRLNTELARLNKGLLNMGPFDGQTLAGVINTNTHGNGFRWGGFADMVRSVDMFVVVPVSAGRHRVERWVIEPTNGISDPSKFNSARKDAFLVQDDDVFHSAVVGYGLFGIAVSYVLEVRELYWLKESVEATTWRAVKDNIAGLGNETRSGKRHQLKIYVNTAQANKQGLNPRTKVRLERLTETPVRMKPNGWENKLHPMWPPARPKGAITSALLTISENNWLMHGTAGDGKPSGAVLTGMNSFFSVPRKDPFNNGGHGQRRDDSAYYRVIRRGRDKHIAVDPNRRSDRRDNTVEMDDPEPQQHGPTIEFAVPADKVKRVVEVMIEQIRKDNINFIAPIGIRFVKASPHFVCPEFGQDLAFVELGGLLPRDEAASWPGYQRAYRTFFTELERAVRQHVPEVRLHLGKVNSYSPAKLRGDFARFDDWLAMYATFSASGVFDCPIATKWGLRNAAPQLSMAQAKRDMEDLRNRLRPPVRKPRIGKG